MSKITYTFAIGIIESFQLNNVGVADNAHDLELTVLESLVLKDSLDGSILSRWGQLGLENNTEGAISDNLALRVLQIPSFSSHSILDLLADHLSHPEAVESVWPMSRHCLDAYVLFEAKMQAKWAKSPGRFNARGMLCVVGAVMGKKSGPMLVT
jgi:hypothetical protein